MIKKIKAIFIGASSGGVVAVQDILSFLDDDFKVPIIVIQHIPGYSRAEPARVYGKNSKGTVLEALDKMPILPGHVYFAPPNYHLLVEKTGFFALNQEDKLNYSRPSIDMTFESAAEAYGDGACGVLLTGANSDGAMGLKTLSEAGAYTIVQDPDTAEVDRMPKAAIQLFSPEYIGSLEQIASKLSELCKESK